MFIKHYIVTRCKKKSHLFLKYIAKLSTKNEDFIIKYFLKIMHLLVNYNNYNANIRICQLMITYVLLLCHNFTSFVPLTPSDG